MGNNAIETRKAFLVGIEWNSLYCTQMHEHQCGQDNCLHILSAEQSQSPVNHPTNTYNARQLICDG